LFGFLILLLSEYFLDKDELMVETDMVPFAVTNADFVVVEFMEIFSTAA
jgi:hypothetical protein